MKTPVRHHSVLHWRFLLKEPSRLLLHTAIFKWQCRCLKDKTYFLSFIYNSEDISSSWHHMTLSNLILCYVWALIRENGFSPAAWHVAVAIIRSSEACITFHSLRTFERTICCAVQHNCRALNCIPRLPVDILRQIEGRSKTFSFRVSLILLTVSLLLVAKSTGFFSVVYSSRYSILNFLLSMTCRTLV